MSKLRASIASLERLVGRLDHAAHLEPERETPEREYRRCMIRATELEAEGGYEEAAAYRRQARIARQRSGGLYHPERGAEAVARSLGHGGTSNPGRRWRSSDVQTLLFPRDRFTTQQAWAWAKEHGFKQASPDVTDDYIRLRQREPAEFGEMRTIEFGRSGIKAVVGSLR